MAAQNFATSMKAELIYEGGKVDDPRDPGGRTNQGVTQRVYNAYRQHKGLAVQDVYKMSDDERDDIFRKQYWEAIHGDDLPGGIDLVVFDGAVNSGPSQSAKWLQRAVGAKVDGSVGTVTIDAAAAAPDHDIVVAAIADRRLAFCKALKTWKTFGHGWEARIDSVKAKGQFLASGSVGDEPSAVFSSAGASKARLEDAKKPLPLGVADHLAGGGAVMLPGGFTLDQVKDQITNYTSVLPKLEYVAFGLMAAGILVPLAAWGYRLIATRHAAVLADALDLPAGQAAGAAS